MKNWWVVASAARARVLEKDAEGRWVHVADLVHPQSRQKGSELNTDRPGHVEGTGHGLGSAAYQPRTDPRRREHEHFAAEVAEFLDAGVAGGRCAGVVLVAAPAFLGELKAHLHGKTATAVLRTVDADYTHLSDAELSQRLAAAD